MNLKDALNISSAATEALSQAMGEAQLLLARKRREREAREQRFEQVVTIMEAEANAAEAEIAALENMIYGATLPVQVPAADPPAQGETAADQPADADQPANTEREAA